MGIDRPKVGGERLAGVGPPLIAGQRAARYTQALVIALRVLGLHALRGPNGQELPSLLSQPKRFPLLAYLAPGEGSSITPFDPDVADAMAASVSLGLNGHEIEATEPEVATAVEGVAARRICEASLAAWVRKRLRPIGGSEE